MPYLSARFNWLVFSLVFLVLSADTVWAQSVNSVINQTGVQIRQVPKAIIAISFVFGLTMMIMGAKGFADYAKDAGRNRWQSALAKMSMGAAIISLGYIYGWAGRSFITGFDPAALGTVNRANLSVFN